MAANLAAILFFDHLNSGFWMVGPSLDCFINKIHKNIIFMPKRSRLVEEKSPVRFSNGKKNKLAPIWNPDTKSVRKMTIGGPDGPVFECLLYTCVLIAESNP